MRSDQDAEFTAYVTLRRSDLVRTATLLTGGDRTLAEDLVQTTLTKVYLAWPRLRLADGPHPYARRVLVNALTDEHRRPWRRREQPRSELPDVSVEPDARGTALDHVGPALAALPPRMRAAVVFRYLHELTVAETAAALNCSEGTVKSQTARGLERMQKLLSPSLSTVHDDSRS
jgi:RNA polymerase sigma-70 factor (sigma-E family)